MPCGHCKTCKYKGAELIGFHEESFVDRPTGYFLCKRTARVETINLIPGLKAIVQDADEYCAALYVEDTFSCVCYELKEGV